MSVGVSRWAVERYRWKTVIWLIIVLPHLSFCLVFSCGYLVMHYLVWCGPAVVARILGFGALVGWSNFKLYASIKESEIFPAMVAAISIGLCMCWGGTKMKLFDPCVGSECLIWLEFIL